jgi:uncharacterized protein (TIGR04255 family)
MLRSPRQYQQEALGDKGISDVAAGVSLKATEAPLPEYDRPPVIETVLGVQFPRLKGFSILHFGLFWNSIRAEYPVQEMKPPLGPVVEGFGVPGAAPEVGIQLLTDPEARCWFIDRSGTQLIQIQHDRFIRNWRRVTGSDAYPRYAHLRPRFERDWSRYLDFLGQEGIDRPQVNQCEVTYVNHVPINVAEFGEAHRVVRALSPMSGAFLPSPETTFLNVRYVMGGQQGRLHVNLQPAIRLDDRSPILQLTLTARGTPRSSQLEDILAWLDLGHEWVVRGFTDFTNIAMHKSWGRTK